MKLAKIIYTISVRETLRNMPIGEEVVIPASAGIDEHYLRQTASRLKKDGMKFTITTKGVLDAHVTRLQ